MVEEATFRIADAHADRAALIELNVEYVSRVASDVDRVLGQSLVDSLGMTIEEYIPGTIDKVCSQTPPVGVFYLVEQGGSLAGMGGLRSIGRGAAEIKRLYVRERYRGHGIGAKILARLLADARAFGYAQVFLDSAPFQASAHRLYEAAGFTDCDPYDGVEVPKSHHAQWRFMQLRLA